MLRLGAGQAIRLLALMNGATSIRKNDVLNVLEVLHDDEALRVFSADIEGVELDRTTDYGVGARVKNYSRYVYGGNPAT